MEKTYIQNTFDGFAFGPDYKQIFFNKPITQLMKEEILRLRHAGQITDNDLSVIKFIYNARFVTAPIIADLLNNGETVDTVQSRLDWLVKCRILNKFMLSRVQEEKPFPDALFIYCMDLGAKELLIQYSDFDMKNWHIARTYWSSENIGNDLVTANFHVKILKTCPDKLVYFRANPEYRINQTVVTPSFEFCLQTGPDTRRYFIGQTVRDFDLPIGFREKCVRLESILCTKAWLKYFHDERENPPTLVLVSDIHDSAAEAAKIISTVSSIKNFWSTTDEMLNKPLNEIKVFMLYNQEEDTFTSKRAKDFNP